MNATVNNLHGLILAGGHSKRMGQDKSLLVYHEKPQVEHAYDLLTPFCAKVFVSNRSDQNKQKGHEHLPQLHDNIKFNDIGPLGGILSAMTAYPNAAWLVLACDLPFVTAEAIHYLIDQRDIQKLATAFISAHDQMPEPLCAIWEAHSRERILKFLNKGIQCPRRILLKFDTRLIIQKDPRWLRNINSLQEYQQTKKFKKIYH